MNRRLVDALVVAVALAASVLPGPGWAATALLVLASVGLWWRARFAAVIFVVAVTGNALHLLNAEPGSIPVDAVTVLAAYAVAAYARNPHRILWPALAVPVLGLAHGTPLGGAVAFAAVGVPWLLGENTRTRRRLAAATLSASVAASVAEERNRIARELHDVVAHHVSVMGVQAGAARLALDADPGRTREALLAIEAGAREAVAEMRRMLGVLRGGTPPTGPAPGFAGLPALAGGFRAAGMPLDLDVSGPVPAEAVQLTAYRIVEQSLTNVLDHAGPVATTVRVAVEDATVEITVSSSASKDARGSRTGGGYGLAGMRERVALFDGTLESGPLPDGGYRVHAVLKVAA